jgi:YidC/Oxa1 family membrane protein insertase
MDKRLGLAIVVSVAILWAWWKLFPPPQPAAPANPPQQSATHEPASPSPAEPAKAAPSAATPAPQAAARPPEQQLALDTRDARYLLSSWGGTLRQVKLKDRQFLLNRRDPESGIELVNTGKPELAPLRTTFAKADFSLPDEVAWAAEQPAPDTVVFRAQTDVVAVEKRYRSEADRYRLNFTMSVQNKSDKPQSHGLIVHLYAQQDPEKKGGGFMSYASANLAEVVCWANDKARRSAVEPLAKDPIDLVGGVRWAAVGEKFFTVAAVPFPESPPKERRCGARALDPLTGEVFLSLSSRTLAPGEKTEYAFELFAGPKYHSDLDRVRPGGEDAHLADDVDVTFAVLSRPMLAMLKFFYRLSGNWGIAIILLTIFVKLVTFYPTQRTLLSAKKMQRLAPKIAALRKKYGNDKQKLGVETMNLYKAHGVSPFGGCLPSLIQMPIWIALFSTLNYAVELHRSSFLYIADLSAKDPYYATPLLMGVVMFLQMRMSPAGADPQQQKMMAFMMPIMFTGFSLFLPAGLSTYTLTSYLLGILQQLYVNWADRRAAATA